MWRTWVSGAMMRVGMLVVFLLIQGCTLPLVPVAAVYRQFLPDCGKTTPRGEACKEPWDWKRAVFGVWTRADSLYEER